MRQLTGCGQRSTRGQRCAQARARSSLRRLVTRPRLAASLASLAWWEEYTFDEYGNRTAVSANGFPPDGLPSLTYDKNTNHVTTAGFSYDAAGNLTRGLQADGSWLRYQYDQAGRLAIVAEDNGDPLEEYGYGADGKRLVTRQDTQGGNRTFFLWDRDKIIAEYAEATSAALTWTRSRFYFGNRILATVAPIQLSSPTETVYFHHPDRLGTCLLTNNANNSAVQQTTLPFGTLIPNAPSNPVNPIFTTYDRSSVTGLDYAVNRHYDSGLRFTQPDPLITTDLRDPQGLNLYSYVGNDPINKTDPAGLQDDGSSTLNGPGPGSGWIFEDGQWVPGEEIVVQPPADWRNGLANSPTAFLLSGSGLLDPTPSTPAAGRALPGLLSSYLGFSGHLIPQTSFRATTALDRLFLAWGAVELTPLLAYLGLSVSGGAVLTSGGDVATGSIAASSGASILSNILNAIAQQYAISAPTTLEGALSVVQQATSSLGYEAGVATEFSQAGMVLQNAGGVVTTLTAAGGITIVNAAGVVVLQLGP